MKEKRREKGAGWGEKAAVGIEGKGRVLEAPRNRSPNAHPYIPSPTPPVAPGANPNPQPCSQGEFPALPSPGGGCGSQPQKHHMARTSLSYLLAACSWKRDKGTDPPPSRGPSARSKAPPQTSDPGPNQGSQRSPPRAALLGGQRVH